MSQIGEVRISLKDGPWRGMTTLSKSKAGEFELLENCYVSSDGSEIRMMPGFVPVIDPETQARKHDGTDTTTGYRATHNDAVRGVVTAVGDYYIDSPGSEKLRIWTEPTHMHCAEQVGGRWIFVGESDFRREPIEETALGNDWINVVSAAEVGDKATINISPAPTGTLDAFNDLNDSNAPFRIWIGEGLTGTMAANLTNQGHSVTGIVGSVLTLDTDVTAGTSATGSAPIAKVTSIDGAENTPISYDVESLTTWTSLDLGDPDAADPNETVYCAHVANRQRDFGDATDNLREGHQDQNLAGYSRSRRNQKQLPYRLVPHVAGDRLVMVAPGYGCVFQAPTIAPIDYDLGNASLGLDSGANDVFDKPRALGIPKAVVWDSLDETSGYQHFSTVEDEAFGGSAAAVQARAGTYKFKFSYFDEATGERGLASEEVVVKTSTSTPAYQGLNFHVLYPGYLMSECLAMRIDIYRTVKNGSSFYHAGTATMAAPSYDGVQNTQVGNSAKYGLTPDDNNATAGLYWRHTVVIPKWQDDDELKERDIFPPVIEQMPMGCKTARTLRGWTIYGGALGDSGSNQELQSGTLTFEYDRNETSPTPPSIAPMHNEFDEVSCLFTAIDGRSLPPLGAETGFGCADGIIPPAYTGRTILADRLFPWPAKQATIKKLVNTKGAFVAWPPPEPGRSSDLRYTIRNSPLREPDDYGSAATRSQTAYLRLPRGFIQVSERDHPGVTPATNQTPISNELNQDIEGIGDMGGQGIIATRSRTYFLGTSGGPAGVDPEIATDKFGCIAPNSMVSYDGGCAWLSDRGPVAMEGGFSWIGRQMQTSFHGESASYKTDSKGMMRHSWACHDPERSLLYFGVFADRNEGSVTVEWAGTDYTWTTAAAHADADKIHSRFPCDEVLVYNYMVRAWSVWRPPEAIAIQWMTTGLDANGTRRVFFLGNDRRLYAMDDAWNMFEKEGGKQQVTESGTLTTLTLSLGAGAKVGVPIAIYSDEAGSKPVRLLYKREITAVDTGAGTVTLDSSVTLTGTEYVVFGVREMTAKGTFFNPKKNDTSFSHSLVVKFDTWSRYSAGVVSTNWPAKTQSSWIGGNVKSAHEEEGVLVSNDSPIAQAVTGDENYDWAGQTLVDDPVRSRALVLGMAAGTDIQVELKAIGGAQMRLHDITVGAQ